MIQVLEISHGSNYNDSFELALIGNKVRALRNPFLERYELIEKYKIF